MPKSHLDSILVKNRKRLARRRAAPPGPEIAFIEAFLSRFTADVIPAIEDAIAREVERACEPMRQRLDGRERAEAGRAPAREARAPESGPDVLEARVIEKLAEWLHRSAPGPGGIRSPEAPGEAWNRGGQAASRRREEERNPAALAPETARQPEPSANLRSIEDGQRAVLSAIEDLRRCLETRLGRILDRLEDTVLNPGNEMA